MKAFKAIFRHGKLYDVELNKRIYLKEDATLQIIIEENQLLTEDPYNKPVTQIAGLRELEETLKKKNHKIKRIASADDQLEFTIKAGKNIGIKKYAMECIFKLQLLEDLYMLYKTPETIYGLVNSSSCVVKSVTGSELKNFESVYAYSLNDAYTKTYEMYFSMYGKSTVNIYNNFYLVKESKKILLAQLRII